jgi:hypothetical protein
MIADRAGIEQGKRASWFVDRLTTVFFAGSAPGGDLDPLVDLAYLDDPSVVAPRSLPTTSMWLAQAWQRGIAGEELPVVAAAVEGTGQPSRDWSPAASLAWAATMNTGSDRTPPSDIAVALQQCPVPAETLDDEARHPLMRVTVSKALATAAGAIAETRPMPRAVTWVLARIQGLTRDAYRAISHFPGRPKSR